MTLGTLDYLESLHAESFQALRSKYSATSYGLTTCWCWPYIILGIFPNFSGLLPFHVTTEHRSSSLVTIRTSAQTQLEYVTSSHPLMPASPPRAATRRHTPRSRWSRGTRASRS